MCIVPTGQAVYGNPGGWAIVNGRSDRGWSFNGPLKTEEQEN